MKAKKVLAGVAVLAMVGACGAALAGCSNGGSTSVKSYTLETTDWAAWADENEHPFSLGDTTSSIMWGWDSWLTSGTKANKDDEGNLTGVKWTITLDIDEQGSRLPGYVEYKLSYAVHCDATEDLYTEDSDMVYSWEGYASKVDGGYRLMVPHFAEVTVVSECVSETFIQGGFENFSLTGPNGGTLYYYYCNSDWQQAGVSYSFPIKAGLIQAISECDVLIKGSAITGFDNVTGKVAPIHELTYKPSEGEGEGPEGPGESQDPVVTPDDEADYSWAPGWAAENPPMSTQATITEETEIKVVAASCNTWKQESSGDGWENVNVTFTFDPDGTVKVEIAGGGPATVYTGTYTAWTMMGNTNYVIQLDNIAGKDDSQSGQTTPGIEWDEEDANVGGGVTIGMNKYYWISKGGKIVLSKIQGGDGYQFNLNQAGGPGGPSEGAPEGGPQS